MTESSSIRTSLRHAARPIGIRRSIKGAGIASAVVPPSHKSGVVARLGIISPLKVNTRGVEVDEEAAGVAADRAQ